MCTIRCKCSVHTTHYLSARTRVQFGVHLLLCFFAPPEEAQATIMIYFMHVILLVMYKGSGGHIDFHIFFGGGRRRGQTSIRFLPKFFFFYEKRFPLSNLPHSPYRLNMLKIIGPCSPQEQKQYCPLDTCLESLNSLGYARPEPLGCPVHQHIFRKSIQVNNLVIGRSWFAVVTSNGNSLKVFFIIICSKQLVFAGNCISLHSMLLSAS